MFIFYLCPPPPPKTAPKTDTPRKELTRKATSRPNEYEDKRVKVPQEDGSVEIDNLLAYPVTEVFDILSAKNAANEANLPGAKRSPKRSKYIMLSSNSICLFLFYSFMLIDAPLTETEKDAPSETLEDRSEAIN